jgi:Periplasmic component of the Tol biopolymer transport system
MRTSFKTVIPIFLLLISSCSPGHKDSVQTDNYPSIYPDYINVTIPYNIAPLNFKMKDKCSKIDVTFSGKKNSIRIKSGYKVSIPMNKWKRLLGEQKNDSVVVSVTALSGGKWQRYKPFSIYVSGDKIDPYLSYRLIEPGYEVYNKLQICERDIENFRERPIIDNNLVDGGCINCHTYAHQDPSRSFFHLRNKDGGTMIQVDGKFRKINTKTDSTISAGVYGNWHPGGRYLAFSNNVIIPEFHSINNMRLEVYDTISDVVVLDIDRNEIIKNPLLAGKKEFETFPAFSADGKKLFFCSAKSARMPQNYNYVRYSLCAIDFDPVTGSFGTQVDTLVSSFRTGKTVSEPKPSPDGKFILFTSFNYGNFPVWHKEADLHLLRLSDMSVDTLAVVNSDNSDTYHSWSSDSRWFVFASKRDNGMYGKPYFAHIDGNGKCSKPFLLPQKNGDFYDYFMKSYNIPEMSTGPVPYNPLDVEKAYRTLKAEPVKFVAR